MFKSLMHFAVIAALFMPSTANACVPPLVQFTFGSAQVPPEGLREMATILRKLRVVPDGKVKLTAATDGSRANRKMSGRRVQAIQALFARSGVPESRVEVEYVSAGNDRTARLILMEVVSAPTCGS